MLNYLLNYSIRATKTLIISKDFDLLDIIQVQVVSSLIKGRQLLVIGILHLRDYRFVELI